MQISLADLARMDNSPWGDEPLVLGGLVEVSDGVMEVSTQRIVDIEQDLLNPLNATIQTETPVPLLTTALTGAVTSGSTISGTTSQPTVQAAAAKVTTIADTGVTDVYTKAQVDALLAAYHPIAGAQGNAAQLAIGGATYTSAGLYQAIFTGVGAQGIYLVPILTMAVLEIFGWDQTSHADSFVDLVAVSTMPGGNIVSVVSTKDLQGTPRARAYTFATGNVCIALAGAPGDTYNVTAGLRSAKVA